MKVAVLKLGARVAYGANDTSGGNGEARSCIKMLNDGGADVHIYTKILKKDVIPEDLNFHQIANEYDGVNKQDYDALVVINGAVNFFGGISDPEQILNYHIINHFKGPVFYIYFDPNLSLKQIWPSIEKKEWAGDWKKEDILITRNDIRLICQVHNTAKAKEVNEKAGITFKDVQHYPLYKFPMLNPRFTQQALFDNQVDISYGGTFRSGKREKKLVQFYFGYPEDISVEVFGKIKLDDFDAKKIEGLRPPLFTGAVAYDKMIPKMAEAKSHIVIGDMQYPEFEMINQRTYEAIQANCITFIDSDFDRKCRVYANNRELGDLLYVSSRSEVLDRLNILKNDTEAMKQIADEQVQCINFDGREYCEDFVALIIGMMEG
jgi:hypothetical protein